MWQCRFLSTFASRAVTTVTVRSLSSNAICTSHIPEISDMCPGVKSYDELYQFSLQQNDKFWGTLARSRLEWINSFDKVSECDMKKGQFSWFVGGKLNVSVNCVDRHFKKTPDKVALIWERDEPGRTEHITYRDLYTMVNQLGNVLRDHGVRKGDRVVIYLPVSPIAVAAMLACSRIGAIHTVVFAGFSANSLAMRIQDANAKIVLTAEQSTRGGKAIELKRIVDAAVEKCPSVQHILMAATSSADRSPGTKYVSLYKEMEKHKNECPTEAMDSEEPLFLLYTSGSTGQPKGILHTQAGYLLYATFTQRHVFDYRDGDIFGCVADVGWITGHSYVVYGPLANGGTTVLFESTPLYPNPGRYWDLVERLRLTHFYGAPTAYRTLLRYGDDWVKKYDRSSLRVIGSVGEPINSEAWYWLQEVVGEERCDIVDTWWQTETGGICMSPRPSSPGAEIKPAVAMRPLLGIEPALFDENGNMLTKNNETGALCLKRPWPGMARSIWGSTQRFLDTYYKTYPGFYFTGDGVHRDEDGHFEITGRMDDVINVTGHRLGTAEVEDALTDHPAVSEAAVVGFPHDMKGEGVYAYVVLKETVENPERDIVRDLKKMVKEKIAGYAVPERILICPGLPRTRSGKIMRRILRKVAANMPKDLGDTSTLADPGIVPVIIAKHELLNR